MNLNAKTCWIFDLDGTLTVPVHDFAFIRRELDIPAVSDILVHLDSLPNDEADKRRTRLREIEIELARKALPSSGALQAVDALYRSGVQLGILTRNDRDIALLTLATIGLGEFFPDSYVLGRDETPPKPDPAGIHHLLSAWGKAPTDAVMVGDYLFDLQAGRGAGTTTIHVARPDGKVWREFTDYALTSLDDLIPLLSP